MLKSSQWDTIIVGAGSAGCVLAARLTEDPNHRVLLIEAGPDHDPNALPEQVEFLGRGYQWPIEWGETVQSSDGRTLPYLRGRGTGGSSSINGGVAMRAEPADLAVWPRGWQWEDMLPWFCALETDQDFGAQAWHGSDGPVPILRWAEKDWDPTQEAFANACLKEGLAACADHNAPDTTGVGPIPMNRDGKRRLSAAVTHLSRARGRENLEILGDTHIERIEFDGLVARGLTEVGGRTHHANRIILAAGVLQSPLLLWRSGIGPADSLRVRGIDCLVDAPGVGQGWTDHMVIQLSTPLSKDLVRPGARGIQVLARATAEGSPYSNDLQLTPWCERVSAEDYRLNLSVSLQQPFGDSSVEALGTRAEAGSAYAWNFPGEKRNIERLRYGYRLGSRLLLASGVSSDSAALTRDVGQTDAAIDAWINQQHGAFYHGVGSCQMGESEQSPLALDLSLKGTENLFVIDGSSIPRVTRSNTHIAIMALAERAAALLRGRETL